MGSVLRLMDQLYLSDLLNSPAKHSVNHTGIFHISWIALLQQDFYKCIYMCLDIVFYS